MKVLFLVGILGVMLLVPSVIPATVQAQESASSICEKAGHVDESGNVDNGCKARVNIWRTWWFTIAIPIVLSLLICIAGLFGMATASRL